MLQLLFNAYKDGEIVNISEVESGDACNCYCLHCNEPLQARKGNIKIHHFAHKSGSMCVYAPQTSLHYLGKDACEEIDGIWLPPFNTLKESSDKWTYHKIKEVILEKRVDNIIPDVILVLEDMVLLFEIYVTHKIDYEKLQKIKKLKLPTVELNLSKVDRNITKEKLIPYIRDILKDKNNSYKVTKKWVYNPEQEFYNEQYITNLKATTLDSDLRRVCPLKCRIDKKGNAYAITEDCKKCIFNLKLKDQEYKQYDIIFEDPLNGTSIEDTAWVSLVKGSPKKFCLGEALIANNEDINLSLEERKLKYVDYKVEIKTNLLFK